MLRLGGGAVRGAVTGLIRQVTKHGKGFDNLVGLMLTHGREMQISEE